MAAQCALRADRGHYPIRSGPFTFNLAVHNYALCLEGVGNVRFGSKAAIGLTVSE